MSGAKDNPDAAEVSRLLAGVARTIESARYCWLATAAENGLANMRPMGRLLHDAGEDEWTIRFITDARTRKVAEMRRAGTVTIIFQHDPDDAFVTLIGKATLCETESGGPRSLEGRLWRLLSHQTGSRERYFRQGRR